MQNKLEVNFVSVQRSKIIKNDADDEYRSFLFYSSG